jgi:histidine ammonia-lyase
MPIISISTDSYKSTDFSPFFKGPVKVRLSADARKAIKISNQVFLSVLGKNVKIYGVNTGFGKLSQVTIKESDQRSLQLNLVRSHAAGVGRSFDLALTRIIMFLKLLTFAKGKSGVRLKLAEQIMDFLNHDILPVIPRQGSVGASGDLAPMSHLALALIGEGAVHFQDRIMPSMLAIKEVNLEPIRLEPKEGLSLINGTQVSTAIAIKAVLEAENLIKTADIAGSLSVEASLSSRKVFSAEVHKLKKHKGQRICAGNIYRMVSGSEIIKSHENCDRVQDPYSFRCQPHVHGTSRDILKMVKSIVENEINSVSDNPLIFENGNVLNSGHFHAEPIAQTMDCLAVAMSEIGAISERRIHYFMKGIGDRVPAFVAQNPGLESGSMTAHITAASLASENKTLSHPASIDSIPTSGGQEDFVSMAPWAGRKLLRIMDNVGKILAIEILVASSASIVFHKKYRPGIGTRPVLNYLKNKITYRKSDHPLQNDIEKIHDLIKKGRLIKVVQKVMVLDKQ